MSAVFTGNGLGLFNTSLNQLGGGLGGQARVGQGGEQQFVNLATGNLVWQGQDEHLTFRGLTVGLGRTYNSLGQASDVGGDGWLTGFERRISLLSGTFNAAGSVMRRHTGDGSYQDFVYVAPGEYRSAAGAGAHDTLSWTGTGWRYIEGSTRQQETYADHADAVLQGRLTGMRNLLSDGATPAGWEVIYLGNRISEIRAEGGGTEADALLFTYDGAGRLEAVGTREGGVLRHQVSYGYDAQGRLENIVTDLTPDNSGDNTWSAGVPVEQANYDGRLFRTQYSYIGTSLQLASVRQIDGILVSFSYHADGRLSTVTRGDINTNDGDGVGETTSYTYGSGSTTVTDSLGRSWVYAFDTNGQLTSLTAPPIDGLSDVTSYHYDADGNVLRTITVRGAQLLAQVEYAYDAAGNVVWEWETTSQWGDRGNAISRTWSATNQLLSMTQYSGVDPDLTGSELPTGGMTTRYVYDSQDRLRFVIDALGNVTESSYAAGGNGVGQLDSQRQYLGDAYAGAYDLASLQAWTTNARRANSVLVELGYDLWGRLAQRTSYAAVDGTGQGVLTDAAELVQYTYDAQGFLRQQITVRGATRTASGAAPSGSQQVDYVYDGMGRLLSTIVRTRGDAGDDPSTLQTSYTYLDSGQQILVLDDADRTTIQTRNSAGRLISLTQQGTVDGVLQQRTQHNYYDAAGQLRASEDAAGGRTYFFYDAKGRIQATVDPTGAVVRTSYDGADRLVTTYEYSQLVTTTSWLVNGQVIPAGLADTGAQEDPLLDRITTRTYDAAGRLETVVEGRAGTTEQSITRYYYDGAGRLVQVTVVGTQDPSERTTRYLYDAAGRQVGVLDAGFYLTESIYDAAGRVIEQVRYATRPEWETWATGSLDELRPQSDAANDQRVRHFYDGRGFRQGTLDAEGYLTEWVNDEAGNVRAERRYRTQLTWSQSDTLASLRSRAGSHLEQRMAYNGLGQLVTQTNTEGTVTRYQYDDAGRLVLTQHAYGSSEVREGHLRFNVFGELIGELSGEGALELLPGMSEAQLDAVYAQHGIRHRYDAMGRRIESVDSAGNKTWYFYDAAGRQAFVVRGLDDGDGSGVPNSMGELTQLRYSAFGEVIERITFPEHILLNTPGDRESARQGLEALLLVGEGATRQYVYNSRGQLAGDISAMGNAVQYDYDAFGQVIRQTSAAGTTEESVSQFDYDNLGNLIETRDAVGAEEERSRSSYYDAFGRVISALDYNGSWQFYTYDRLGRQLSMTVPTTGSDRITSRTYDAYDRLLTVVDAQGGVTQYGYDEATRTTTLTSPEGVVTTTAHNRHGQVIRATTPVGYTEYGYNASGQLLRTETRASDGTLVLSQSQEHDAARGLLTATVDGAGRRVEFHYDAAGRVLSRIVDPAGAALITRYTYDGQGLMTSVTDASGRETWYSYDQDGRLFETVQDPNDLYLETQYKYDAAGRQVLVTEASGSSARTVTRYEFDLLGRRISETVDDQGLQLVTRYEYDANDNVVARVSPDGARTRFYYNEANELTHQIDPLGAVTRFWYDRLGRQVATRSFIEAISLESIPEGATYYELDQLLSWQAEDTGDYRAYDRDGRLRFTGTLGGSVTELSYDAAGRLTATRSFATAFVPESSMAWLLRDGSFDISLLDTSFLADDVNDQRVFRVYDAAGQVRFSIDALGQVTETSYDRSGWITGTVRYANAITLTGTLRAALESGSASVSDIASVLAPATNDQRSLTVADAAGRAAFSIDAAGVVVQRSFDGAGRVIQTRRYATPVDMTPALVASIQSGSLTAAGLSALISADPARDRIQSSIYDGAGRELLRVDESGTLQEWRYDAMGRVTVHRRYDQPVQMSQDPHGSILAGTLDQYNYGEQLEGISEMDYRASYHYYDGAGRRTVTVETASTAYYSEYLTSYPLTGVVTTWTYDASGRVSSESAFGRSLGYISMSELESADAYWVLERVTDSWYGPPPRRDTVYRYDAAGRLEYTVTSDFSMVRNHYNALGQLTRVTNYGVIDALPETPFFLWSASDVELQSMDGVQPSRNTWYEYDAAGRRIEEIDALGNSAHYTYDAIGRLLSYENRLGHVWSYDYDSAGRQISETSPQVDVATADATGAVTTQRRSVVTLTGYDSFGNVISRTEDATSSRPRTVTYEYDVRGNQIRTVFPTSGQLDADGNLVDTETHSSIEVTYDALGRAIAQRDVRGNYSYKIYDIQDRVVFDIDQEGYVTEYQYNAHGEQTRLRRLANRAEASPVGQSAQQFAEQLIYSDYQDRVIDTFYDAAGRKSSVIQLLWDGRLGDGGGWTYGATVRYFYNGYGDLVVERSLTTTTRSWGSEPPAEEVLPVAYGGEYPLDNWEFAYGDTYHYYDEIGREIKTVDQAGYLTTRSYDAAGELSEVIEHARALEDMPRDPEDVPGAPLAGDAGTGYDRVTRYTYDALGRRIGETQVRHYRNIGGAEFNQDFVTWIDYDDEGRIVSKDVDGVQTSTRYDELGRVISVEEAERDVLAMDVAAQMLLGADPATLYERASPYTSMVYDAFGNLVQTRRYARGLRNGELITSDNDAVHTFRYDFQGRAVWERDAVGTVYTRRYDEADNLLSTQYRLEGNEGRWSNVVHQAEYDAIGRQTLSWTSREQYQGQALVGEAQDAISQVRYNAFGEIVAKDNHADMTLHAEELAAQYWYDGNGRLSASNAQGGGWRMYTYDLQGRQLSEMRLVSTLAEDGQIETGQAVTLNELDALGRVVRQTLPAYGEGVDAPVIETRYDRWGNVLEVIDPRGASTQYLYNELNQVIREIRPEARVVDRQGVETLARPTLEFYYDARGQLIGVRDANGNVRLTHYDEVGRVSSTVDGTEAETRFFYDTFGQQRLTQDPLGYVTFRDYDQTGRIFRQGDYLRGEGGTRTHHVREQYVLNQNGDRLVVTDALGNSTHYDYDSRHLVTRSRTAEGVVMDYGYDANGNKIRETQGISDPVGLLGGTAPTLPVPVPFPNGSFEAGADGWTLSAINGATLGVVTGSGVDGGNALRLVGTGEPQDGSAFLQEAVAVTPGQLLNINAMVRLEGGTYGTSYSLVFAWEDANGVQTWASQSPQMRGEVGADWHRASWSAQVPVDAVAVRVGVYLNASDSGTPSVILVDDFGWNLTTPQATDGRTRVTDEEGEIVFLDEQTWDYDYFNRVVDHNDLGGVDYDYEYDVASGQLIRQSLGPELPDPENQPPEIVQTYPRQDLVPGQPWSFSVFDAFLDPNGDALTFSAERSEGMPLPAWLSLDPQTGLFTGTPPEPEAGFAVWITATDPQGESVVLRLDIWVPDPTQGGSGTLPNLGFESGDVEWNKGNDWTINWENDTDAYAGEWSARFGGLGNSSLWHAQTLAVTAGQTFAGSVRIQTRGGSAELLLGWYDVNGNLIKLDKGSLIRNGSSWTYSSKTATAPAGAVRLGIGVSAQNDAGEGPVLVDQFSLAIASTGGTGGGGGGGGGTDIPVQQQSVAYTLQATGESEFETSGAGDVAGLGPELPGAPVPQADSGAKQYFYYPNGQIREIREVTPSGVNWTRYAYDASGNRVLEETRTVDASGAILHLRTQSVFDSHNRLESMTQDDLGQGVRMLEVRYAYDAMGNRRRVEAVNGFTPTTPNAPFNANFEQGDSGWELGEGFVIEDGGYAQQGEWKAVHRGTGTSMITNENRVPVIPGQSLEARGYYHQGSADSGDNWGEVWILWYDTNGTEIGQTRGNRITSSDGGFRLSTARGNAPAGAAFAAIAGYSYKTRGTDVRFDNFSWNYRPVTTDPNGPANLDFEQGANGWTLNGVQIASGSSDGTGSQVARFSYNGGQSGSIVTQQRIEVEAGTVFTASARMRVTARVDQIGGAMRVLWFDANDNFISSTPGSSVNAYWGGGYPNWTTSSVSTSVPQGAVYARLQGEAYALRSGADVEFDNFSYQLEGSDDLNRHTYWYDYDAENRVTVTNGRLVNGVIEVAPEDTSFALGYDAAGRASFRRFLDDGVLKEEQTLFDERGQRTHVFQAYVVGATAAPVSLKESFVYDEVGRQLERREYFDQGTVRNGVNIGGWLQRAEVTTYDADGRVTLTTIKGRGLDWVAEQPVLPVTDGLLPNLDFESGDTQWNRGTGWTISQENVADAYSGAWSARYGGLGNSSIWHAQSVEVTAGQSYTGSVKIQTRGGSAELLLGWFDASGNLIKLDKGSLIRTGSWWTSSSRTVTAPAGAVRLSIGVSAQNDGGEGPVIVDHFNLVASGTGSSGNTGGGGDTGGGGSPENPIDEQMLKAAMAGLEPSGNPQIDSLGSLVDLARVSYTGAGAGYDQAGRLQGYRYTLIRHEEGSGANGDTPANYTHTYTYQYEGRESYLEKQVYGSSTNPDFKASTSASTYDAWGRRVAIRQNTPGQNDVDDTVRYFSYDGENQILRRRQGTLENGVFTQTTAEAAQTQLYAYVSGQQVGSGKYNGELDVIGRLTAYSTQAGSTQTTVQAGETLRSIAQRVYGNENLWYVLAQANALTGEETLAGGTTLTVPEVKVTANDSNTFKPFNPSEAIGNTAPELPYIPPPPKDKCGVLSSLIGVVVAVVVTVYSGGNVAAGAAAGDAASQASAAMLNGRFSYGAFFRGIMDPRHVAATTLASLSPTFGTALVGAGLAGNEWARNVLNPLDYGMDYDYTRTAIATAAGYAGGAAGGWVSTAVGGAAGSVAGSVAGAATGAAVGYSTSYSLNKAAGRDVSFSWRELAASAVTAAAAAGISRGLGVEYRQVPGTSAVVRSNPFSWNAIAADALSNIAGYGIRRGFGIDHHWSNGEMIADVFGNVLGNALAGGSGRNRSPISTGSESAKQIAEAQRQADAAFDDQLGAATGNLITPAERNEQIQQLINEIGLSPGTPLTEEQTRRFQDLYGITAFESREIELTDAQVNLRTFIGHAAIPEIGGFFKQHLDVPNLYVSSDDIQAWRGRFWEVDQQSQALLLHPHSELEAGQVTEITRVLSAEEAYQARLDYADEVIARDGRAIVKNFLLRPALMGAGQALSPLAMAVYGGYESSQMWQDGNKKMAVLTGALSAVGLRYALKSPGSGVLSEEAAAIGGAYVPALRGFGTAQSSTVYGTWRAQIGAIGEDLSDVRLSGGQVGRAGTSASGTTGGAWRTVNESMSSRARAYQSQVTGRPDEAYIVGGVKFDGLDEVSDALLDAKGLGYANFVNKSGRFYPWWRGADSLVSQAQRQVAVSNGAPIQWHVAEQRAAEAMRRLLAQNDIRGIQVIHTPVKGKN